MPTRYTGPAMIIDSMRAERHRGWDLADGHRKAAGRLSDNSSGRLGLSRKNAASTQRLYKFVRGTWGTRRCRYGTEMSGVTARDRWYAFGIFAVIWEYQLRNFTNDVAQHVEYCHRPWLLWFSFSAGMVSSPPAIPACKASSGVRRRPPTTCVLPRRPTEETAADDAAALSQINPNGRESFNRNCRESRALRVFCESCRPPPLLHDFSGHHADDLVETFLINLFRGAGAAGLSSLREISAHQIGKTKLMVVRPLLAIWRKQIDDYITAHRIQFREDQTNKDFGPLRNRVRHRVTPYLERVFGRNIRQSIWRAAMIAAEENDWINSLLDEQATSATELSVQKLRVQPIAAQRRVLQKWLRRHGVADVGYDLIERVRELLAPAQSVAKTNLPGARHVRRKAKKIFIDG